MAREKKPINWGVPGQTGFTRDGVPWYVPETGPTRADRFQRWLLQLHGSDDWPVGARLIPAKTPDEARERSIRRYGDRVAKVLREGEEIEGFIQFVTDDHVPQPPRVKLEAKIGPNKLRHWWMGGDWNTAAGKLVMRLGNTREHDGSGAITRRQLLVRTRSRIVITAGSMYNPLWILAEYSFDQIGLRPGWQPGDPAKGEGDRVDIAFSDGSWIGVIGQDHDVPGSTEDFVIRDLIAQLIGPPVTATVLPALGLGS